MGNIAEMVGSLIGQKIEVFLFWNHSYSGTTVTVKVMSKLFSIVLRVFTKNCKLPGFYKECLFETQE